MFLNEIQTKATQDNWFIIINNIQTIKIYKCFISKNGILRPSSVSSLLYTKILFGRPLVVWKELFMSQLQLTKIRNHTHTDINYDTYKYSHHRETFKVAPLEVILSTENYSYHLWTFCLFTFFCGEKPRTHTNSHI